MSNREDWIGPVADAALEAELRARLNTVAPGMDSDEPLAMLAVRLGLIQQRPAPWLHRPSLVVFAADHGLAVDNIAGRETETTAETVDGLLTGRLPLGPLARAHGLGMMVVDSGIAEPVASHEHLHARKIAHGTRNVRFGKAMSLEQMQAAIRAGIEIGRSLDGNAVACAGLGVGSRQSAALLMSSLADVPLRDFRDSGPVVPRELLDHRLHVLESARQRHLDKHDPLELLAAMGGFEIAMLVGLMLSASARRLVIFPDGLPACAALLVACSVTPAVADYCVLVGGKDPVIAPDRSLDLSEAVAMSDIGDDDIDGTNAASAWPLVTKAAAILTAAE